jgi:TolA-binding protein
MKTAYPVLLALLWLNGCSMWHKDNKPEPPTIATIENQEVSLDQGGALDTGRNQAIQSYRDFLKSSTQNQYHAEAMRRIADLEQENLEERLNQPLTDKGATPVRDADYEKVVTLYNNMLRTHPDYPSNDGVLYQLAKVHEQAGEIEKALESFDRLVRDYPKSKYITEVQFRRGEILFVLQKYKKAKSAYAAVLKAGRNSPFYERALYKHGWTWFKLSQYEEGLDSFMALLDIKFVSPDTGQPVGELLNATRGEKELLSDSFRVISLSFSYLDGPRSIKEYFEHHKHRLYEYQIYRQLGDLYMQQERIRDAADTYNAFVRSDPDHRMAPDFQSLVINAYTKGGFLSLTLEAKEEFVTRYNKQSHYWQIHSDEDKARITPLLMTHLEDLARYYHAQAQKLKKPEVYQKAARWYRMYVDSFPDDSKTPGMNFLLAELLFEAKDYEKAGVEYEKTAYGYPPHKQSAEAGYAALLAYAKHEESLPANQRAVFHMRTIDSGIRFADTYPQDKRTAAVLTRAADELFQAKQYDRAAGIATRVIQIQPPAEQDLLRTAWTVLAHTQFQKQEYQLAEQSYTQVLQITGKNSKLYAPIHERLVASIYKQGESARDAGNHREAVGHFLRIARVAPASDIRPVAEYDAAASLMILKDWDMAGRVLENFRRNFPNHALNKTVPEKLAVVYLNSQQPGKAASEMERIAKTSTNPQIVQESRWQAAELYAKAGAHQSAIKAYINYFTEFPRPFEQAIEARNKVLTIYKDLGDRKQTEYWTKELVKAEAAGGAARTQRTRYLGASSAFVLAEPLLQDFKRSKLTIPLKKSLASKKIHMKKAIKAYEGVAAYKIAEFTTAATYNIAEIYNDFSRDLLKSQRPKGLSPEELEQYNVLLEEQSYPFEEKAIDIHEANAARTVQGIYDSWVKKSLEKLAKLRPIQYAKSEKSEVVSRAMQ